ncbi:MAG: hypothetical protein ACJAVI_000791 [Candidatus Azotimanducaceae bacterium]|jgi:hypothetical protein
MNEQSGNIANELSRELERNCARICNAILISFAVVAIPTLLASLYRAASIGWQSLMYLHVLLTIGLWITVFFRKKIPYQLQAGFIIFTFLLAGLTGISRFGLAAAGVAFLVASGPLATLLFNARIGVATLIIGLIGAISIGFITTQNGFSHDFDPMAYALAPSSWITAIFGWALSSIVLSASLHVFNKELISALSKSQQRQQKLGHALAELDKTNLELQSAFDEIAQLQGIIPICSYCHSIRDDQGAWNQLEAYLSEHSEAQFSHGICPPCSTRLAAELPPSST